jgi:hypothetical protein
LLEERIFSAVHPGKSLAAFGKLCGPASRRGRGVESVDRRAQIRFGIRTRRGKPLSQSNLLYRLLYPLLAELKIAKHDHRSVRPNVDGPGTLQTGRKTGRIGFEISPIVPFVLENKSEETEGVAVAA